MDALGLLPALAFLRLGASFVARRKVIAPLHTLDAGVLEWSSKIPDASQ